MSAATARARADHARVWSFAGVALVAGAGIVYVLQLSQYFVMPDELTYQRQTLAIASSGLPLGPSSPEYTSISQLPQVIRAPLFGAFGTVAATDLAHVLNVLLFVSAAAPAYLLARRVTGSAGAAALTSVACVMVPWLAMAGSMMTEPVAYPAFVWALLGMQLALAEPGLRNYFLGFGGIALAALTRSQFIVMLGVLAAAALVREAQRAFLVPTGARADAVRTAVRNQTPLLGVVGVVALVVIFLGPGRVRRSSLGYYDTAATGGLFAPGTGHTAVQLMGGVALACGAIPLALSSAWAISALRNPGERDRHVFALLFLLGGITILVIGASFTARFATGLNDRYVEYLAPLLLIGTAAALTAGRPRALALAVCGAGTVALIAATDLATQGLSLISPGAAFQSVLRGRTQQLTAAIGAGGVGASATLALVTAAAIATIIALGRRGPLPATAIAIALLAFLAIETGYTLSKLARTQRGADAAFLAQRSWIDRGLGDGRTAEAIIGSIGDPVTTTGTWWSALFWNGSVTAPYVIRGTPTFEQSFPRTVTIAEGTGRMSGVSSGYAVVPGTNRTFALRGAALLASAQGLDLVRLAGPPTLAWRLRTPDDSATLRAGAAGALRIFGDGHSAAVPVEIVATAHGGTARLRVADGHGHVLAMSDIAAESRVRVRLRPRRAAGGGATLALTASAATPGATVQILDVRLGR